MHLVSLVASTRPGSVNRALYTHVAHLLEAEGHKITEIDYAEVEDLAPYTAQREAEGIPASVLRMAEMIREADGLVMAAPEYNFSLPGTLKNAIDWISRIKPYVTIGKPVLLMSASGSPLGGWRGLSALRVPLACLGAHVAPWDITVGGVTTPDAVAQLCADAAFGQRVKAATAFFA